MRKTKKTIETTSKAIDPALACVPVYLFGPSQVGKTSFLMSLLDYVLASEASSASRHGDLRFVIRRRFRGYFDELEPSWRTGILQRTKKDQPCGLEVSVQNAPALPLLFHDYDGRHVRREPVAIRRGLP